MRAAKLSSNTTNLGKIMGENIVPVDEIKQVLSVLTLIAEAGLVPTKACDHAGVSYGMFARLTTTYPQLAQLRMEAEDRLYDRMAEALPNIDNDRIYGRTDAKMANVISGNIKWLLERRRQKAYGAKSTIEHMITADREVLDALNNAKARAQGKLVEAVVDNAIDLTVIDGMAQALGQTGRAATMTRQTQFGVVHSQWDEDAFQREFAEIC